MNSEAALNSLWRLSKKDLQKLSQQKDFTITRLTKELESLSASYAAAIDKNIQYLEEIKSKNAEIEALRSLDGSAAKADELKAEVDALREEVSNTSKERDELKEKLRIRENEISILRAGLIREQNNAEQKALLAKQAIEKDEYIAKLENELEKLRSSLSAGEVAPATALAPESGAQLYERLNRLEGERDKVIALMLEIKDRENEIFAQAEEKAAAIEEEAAALLSDAKVKAEGIVISAQKESEAIIGEAKKQADAAVAAALTESSQILAASKKEAERINLAREKAEEELEQIISQLESRKKQMAEVSGYLAKLNARISSLLGEAEPIDGNEDYDTPLPKAESFGA